MLFENHPLGHFTVCFCLSLAVRKVFFCSFLKNIDGIESARVMIAVRSMLMLLPAVFLGKNRLIMSAQNY